MNFEVTFYQFDHRLIALTMVAVLAVACEIGLRTGSRKRRRFTRVGKPNLLNKMDGFIQSSEARICHKR